MAVDTGRGLGTSESQTRLLVHCLNQLEATVDLKILGLR